MNFCRVGSRKRILFKIVCSSRCAAYHEPGLAHVLTECLELILELAVGIPVLLRCMLGNFHVLHEERRAWEKCSRNWRFISLRSEPKSRYLSPARTAGHASTGAKAAYPWWEQTSADRGGSWGSECRASSSIPAASGRGGRHLRRSKGGPREKEEIGRTGGGAERRSSAEGVLRAHTSSDNVMLLDDANVVPLASEELGDGVRIPSEAATRNFRATAEGR